MGIRTFFVFGLATTLCGCGAVDSQVTFVPAFLRQEAPTPNIEQPPDVHLIVRNNISAISCGCDAKQCQVCFPSRQYGGWTTCVE
jgi:hypothetical protein